MIINGNNLEVLDTFPDNYFDSVVTDPPYGLKFMGKKWDYDVPSVELWQKVYRVLKSGGHVLSFGGSRTYHRMAVAIEDAGFEIRDMIEYVYGSGFPKSLNVFKQLKKQCRCGNMEVYENRVQQVGANREEEAEYYMRFVRDFNIPQTKSTDKKSGEVLQSSLSEQSTPIKESTKERIQFSKRGNQPSMEGRHNSQTTERELQRREIHQVSREISSDGKERWIHNGTQISDGTTLEQNAYQNGGSSSYRPQSEQQQYQQPCSFCQQWGAQAARSYGTGTALKPAHEPCVLARKPTEGNVAQNCLKHGVGGLNIDGTRVELRKYVCHVWHSFIANTNAIYNRQYS